MALGVEYDGGAFHGFQSQKHASSVQQALEAAITKVADEPVRIVAAGRTDAGVHATGQVVSFATSAERSVDAWRRGVSSLTPESIGIVWAEVLDKPFHARFDALWRRYVYVYSDASAKPVIHRNLVGWSRGPLTVEPMHAAAQCLLGSRTSRRFARPGANRRRRADASRRSAWRGSTATWRSTLPPTRSCCTWCATSPARSVRWGPANSTLAPCGRCSTVATGGRLRRRRRPRAST